MSQSFYRLEGAHMGKTRSLAAGTLEVRQHEYPMTSFTRIPIIRDALKKEEINERVPAHLYEPRKHEFSRGNAIPTMSSGGISGKLDPEHRSRMAKAKHVMKGIRLEDICDPSPSNDLVGFWLHELSPNDMKYDMHIQPLSEKNGRCQIYLSYSPSMPQSWEETYRGDSYGYLHASQLYYAAETISDITGVSFKKVLTNYYCFHSNGCRADELLEEGENWHEESLKLAGEFIGLSDHVVTFIHHEYFASLRCCYEWALICMHKPFKDIEVGLDMFFSAKAFKLLTESIKNLSADSLAINMQDNALIRREICRRFAGHNNQEKMEAFERFVRISSIVLCARFCCFMITKHSHVRQFLIPWWDVAEHFGYAELSTQLRKVPYIKWCAMGDISSERKALRRRCVEAWFEDNVQDMLMHERDMAFDKI